MTGAVDRGGVPSVDTVPALTLTVVLYHGKDGKTMAAQRFFEIGSREFVVDFRLLVGGRYQARCSAVRHTATGGTIDGAFTAFLETLPDAWVEGVIVSLPVQDQRQVRLWRQDEAAVHAA